MSEARNSPVVSIQTWVEANSNLRSVVLFGSSVSSSLYETDFDSFSDLDLHVVADDIGEIISTDWNAVFPTGKFVVQALRPATGGVQKLTVLFLKAQLDLVLIPTPVMISVQQAVASGVYRNAGSLSEALNEMATCLRTGYRFLKGEEIWQGVYETVARDMLGVRIDDLGVCRLAQTFLCDLIWVLQKIDRGELIAAQHQLHKALSETNLKLLRELRLRQDLPVKSFGLGRRLETLLDLSQIAQFSISSPLEEVELKRSALKAFSTLKILMSQLVPKWVLPLLYSEFLKEYHDDI